MLRGKRNFVVVELRQKLRPTANRARLESNNKQNNLSARGSFRRTHATAHLQLT
jgi:hypothetical protein